VLLVSGRGGFEIVQKTIVAGIPLLASVSAPSSLAVQLARELGLTLVGFLRGRRFVIYSGEERIAVSASAPAGASDMLSFSQTPGRPPLLRLFVISRRVHVSQGQFARIDAAPLARVDKIHAKLLDSVGNFSHPPRQCGSNRRAAFAAVHRGQRLDSSLGSRNDGFALRERIARESSQSSHCAERYGRSQATIKFQRECVAARAVAIPARGPSLGAFRSALSPSVAVCDYVQSERRISAGRSHNRDLRDERLEQSSGVKDQRDAVKIEKSLVAAHARTGTPPQE
jgi:hypothetical protein